MVKKSPSQQESARWLSDLGLTTAIEQYLSLRGFDLSNKNVQAGITGIKEILTLDQDNAIAQTALRTEIPADQLVGNKKVDAPAANLAIPSNPIEIFNNFFASNKPQVNFALTIKALSNSPEQISQIQEQIKLFLNYAGSEKVYRDPFLANIADQASILSQITSHPLYQISAPIISWLNQKFVKSKIIAWLGKTAFGQTIKNISEKAISWGIQQVGKRIALEGGKQLTKKGLAAAIASALGIPTGGASVLIWLGTEAIIKLGQLFKKLAEKTKIPQLN